MSEQLKREFLELLERDREFRYAVAGYLGFSELMKRMDRAWAATVRLWRETRKMRKEQEKTWEEIKAVREEQKKLWENVEKLWMNQEKLLEEVRALRESQEKLSIELKTLREGQDELRASHTNLSERVDTLERYVRSGFEGLRKALRYTFEDFASGFVKVLLEDMGYPEAKVERGYIIREGKVTEVDIFCEDPLVVGEVTLKVETPEEAEAEAAKLLERAEGAKLAYGREPLLKILCVARAEPAAAETLRRLASNYGFMLVMEEVESWQ